MAAIDSRRALRRARVPVNRRARLVLALVVAVTLAALLGRSAEPVLGADCVVVPVVRGAMLVDQGLSSYADSPLVRGHDTLLKVTLSGPQTLPSCATTGASAFLDRRDAQRLPGRHAAVDGSHSGDTRAGEPVPADRAVRSDAAGELARRPRSSACRPTSSRRAPRRVASRRRSRRTITYQSRSSATASPDRRFTPPVTVSRDVTVEAGRTAGGCS